MARVLLIDDEAEVRRGLRVLLEAAQHRVLEARNGEEALRLIRRHDVDVVITDVIMPGLDGLEVMKAIRLYRPELRTIAISGGGLQLSADACCDVASKMGAYRVLRKPISSEALTAAIDSALSVAQV
jgi:DNA-binding NtrC family response regulator